MDDCERLALAALAHDLPALLQQAAAPAPAGLQRAIDLARLDDAPALAAILDQAEAFALAGAADRTLASGQPLLSIFSRVVLDAPDEPPPVYRRLAPLPSTNGAMVALFPAERVDTARFAAYLNEFGRSLATFAASVDLARFDHAYPHLLALLQRYGWCLPAHRTTSRSTTTPA